MSVRTVNMTPPLNYTELHKTTDPFVPGSKPQIGGVLSAHHSSDAEQSQLGAGEGDKLLNLEKKNTRGYWLSFSCPMKINVATD